ncbi:MAG TPA: carboxypeptidase regulatory-like domain-containing protein, partial [Candidatus Baltobacteraceae bacterium]
MTKFVRILAVVAIAALTVGPVSAATVSSVANTTIAQDATTGSVSGTIRDNSGAPLANARIRFAGPATYATTSDNAGAFSIASVTPGIYVVTASKTGYVDAEIDDFAVIAGTTGTLNASLTAQTLTSLNLQTIARVSARRGTSFNTSTASVNVVSAQQFADNGSPQVTRVLNSIPGVQISLPSSSGNGAVPGAITFPNIRGALSYETASLIDGHPVSVGKYGDYVTTFFNANMLQGAEVIKGPGELSPETNYAIGGTINFRTKDPTETMVPDYSFGVDNWGGTFSNFGVSDTVGRLGFVLDFASIAEPSAVNGAQVYFNPSTSGTVCPPGGGGAQCQVLYQSPKASFIPGTASKINDQFPLVACCDAVSGQYNNESELVKFRYKFSDATSLTASYLGSQSSADQNGNTSSLIPSLFTPAVAYNNPAFPANSQFLMSSEFPGIPENEYNNEPIFQAEAHTTIGNDTVLARYYHADISRIIQTAGGTDSSAVIYANLYGVGASASGSGTTVYSGQVTPITFFNAFTQSEIDTLGGVSLEYQHPFSANNTLTLSAESTSSKTTTGSLSSDDAFNSGPVQPHTIFWSSITPQGSGQIFNTYLARDSVQVGRKLNATLSLYENTYRSTF